ncbi:hypothetical protein NKI82_33040 [Mesorhizobium sp. M0482]
MAHEYRYLRSYDPYYNLSADRPLPPTYVDGALDDGQVLYYQPARYVAHRRSCAADRDPELVFRTRMVGGHSGASHGPGVAEEAAFRMAYPANRITAEGQGEAHGFRSPGDLPLPHERPKGCSFRPRCSWNAGTYRCTYFFRSRTSRRNKRDRNRGCYNSWQGGEALAVATHRRGTLFRPHSQGCRKTRP